MKIKTRAVHPMSKGEGEGEDNEDRPKPREGLWIMQLAFGTP